MKITGYGADSFYVEESKSSARKRKEIKANKAQKKILEEIQNLLFAEDPDYDIHALWHSVPEYEKGMSSYTYASMLDKWASDEPTVKQFSFDDSMFMSSTGFIIPSMSKYKHMGVNVILCPQCGDPVDFFCYPSHLASLLEAFGAAQETLLSVPAVDHSSPNYLRRQELEKQLLDSVSKPA